jgi:hypothetical protein
MTVSENFYITESPWLISKQLGWEPQIVNPDLPYWVRVHAVAMARSEPNLHTPLEAGELAGLLGRKQPDGSTKPVDRRDLNRYINRAVELNYLDETSSVRCLVLPADTMECRLKGNRKPCRYHTGHASKIKRPLAIKRAMQDPLKRTNSGNASPQFKASHVGEIVRQRRTESTPTPGSRDIYTVKTVPPPAPVVPLRLFGTTGTGPELNIGTDGWPAHRPASRFPLALEDRQSL